MKKFSSAEAGITTSSASASPSGPAVNFFATFLAILSLFATAADARPFDVRDLVSLNRVSDPQLSPDQEQVAFALRRTELKADKGVSGIWMVPAGGGDSIRLTKKGRDARHPRWSPDGSSVYFIRKHEDSKQIWRVELASGKSKRVSNYPIDVDSFEVSPDGSAIALSMKVFRDCDTLACTSKRLDDRGDDKVSGELHNQLFIRHWDTWKDGRRSQLYVATIDDKGKAEEEPIHVSRGIDGDIPSMPFGDASEYAFSPTGDSLAFAARIAGRTESWSTNFDLFSTPADGASPPENLTADNLAMDSKPLFSRDGKTLYYLAMKRPGFEADRLAIMARTLASGETREIAPDWDRSAGSLSLSADGSTIYTTADDDGEKPLFAIDVDSGVVRRVVAAGNINGFSIVGDTIVFGRDTLKSPSHLFAMKTDGSPSVQLTSFNSNLLKEIAMGDFEFFDFPGWNDERVQGYVVKPFGYVAGKKYPVAFLIHGGPQGAMSNDFHYRWNPQTYSGQGYAVVTINFHGSTGYGQAFTDSISGDWGGKPLVDLQKGLAAALERYDWLDGERVCALGASYGGYMINWIAGNWNEAFRCLVNHDGVFDNRSMTYTTEELWFDEWEMGGTQFEHPEYFEKHNPVNHVAQWSTPMLVVHGQLDYRVPVEQGIAAFTALQRRGIESQFLYFPDENHWVLKPQNSIQWHDTVNNWLERWLK
jgi:dipeptidyl aminopeptidase/acylaminoacyl peptidase